MNFSAPVWSAAKSLIALAGAAGFEPADAGTKNRMLRASLLKSFGICRGGGPVCPCLNPRAGFIGFNSYWGAMVLPFPATGDRL